MKRSEIMLQSKEAWENTYCESKDGWPGNWLIIWRAKKYHGKIGTSLKSKNKPSPKRIAKELEKELLRRFESVRRCDGKRVAVSWLADRGQSVCEAYPVKDAIRVLEDLLYDLDVKIAGEFFSNEPPRLFGSSSHGYLLGDLCEARGLVAYIKGATE